MESILLETLLLSAYLYYVVFLVIIYIMLYSFCIMIVWKRMDRNEIKMDIVKERRTVKKGTT